jgi:TolA-binding protein
MLGLFTRRGSRKPPRPPRLEPTSRACPKPLRGLDRKLDGRALDSIQEYAFDHGRRGALLALPGGGSRDREPRRERAEQAGTQVRGRGRDRAGGMTMAAVGQGQASGDGGQQGEGQAQQGQQAQGGADLSQLAGQLEQLGGNLEEMRGFLQTSQAAAGGPGGPGGRGRDRPVHARPDVLRPRAVPARSRRTRSRSTQQAVAPLAQRVTQQDQRMEEMRRSQEATRPRRESTQSWRTGAAQKLAGPGGTRRADAAERVRSAPGSDPDPPRRAVVLGIGTRRSKAREIANQEGSGDPGAASLESGSGAGPAQMTQEDRVKQIMNAGGRGSRVLDGM